MSTAQLTALQGILTDIEAFYSDLMTPNKPRPDHLALLDSISGVLSTVLTQSDYDDSLEALLWGQVVITSDHLDHY